MINKIIDLFRKRNILRAARASGCDSDGDLIKYKGVTYFIYYRRNIVSRI